ncbi:MAG: 16S rRNA (guanine(966)-N(2))-methyltransferase RsmD [Christensenellales bacterium]|jgi:16S rRNA (guanine966-N2)-methyltransferase
MRIIAGSAGGRRLVSPPGQNARPTHERVREAVFSMLTPFLSGGRVLDLFAGSGAMGLEALSRGMDEAIFVDADRGAVRTIQSNIEALGFNRCRVLHMDALRALDREKGPFDLAFVDPPYDAGLMMPALEKLAANKLIAPGARIVCERRFGDETPVPGAYDLLRRRRYGIAEILLLSERELKP